MASSESREEESDGDAADERRRRRRRPLLRLLELALFVVAVVCLGLVVYWSLDARLFDWRQERRLDEAIAAHRAPAGKSAHDADRLDTFRAASAPPPLAEGTLIGRIELPRLGLSTLVLEGTSPLTLRRGAGHIAGTPLPEAGGNVGVAGHRDTVFRPLRDARPGDKAVLTTPTGSYRYEVEWTRVVEPEEVSVLAASTASELTLVTCYPFDFIGAAPQRFIVRAQRVE
ncbi:MAG TPA: class D sortase [Thermoanaerobaculia bacterium]